MNNREFNNTAKVCSGVICKNIESGGVAFTFQTRSGFNGGLRFFQGMLYPFRDKFNDKSLISPFLEAVRREMCDELGMSELMIEIINEE